jgi:tetratricopeptide (TPR) repeat protein
VITSALGAHEFDKALTLLAPEIHRSPQNPKLWTLQALALSGKGDKKSALAAYDKALKLSPDYLPALEGAAQIEYDAGSQAAVALLKNLLRLRPNDPTTHGMLAVLSFKRGDCDQAIEHFDRSGPLLDSQSTARAEYTFCALKLNQPQKAISFYEKYLEANPRDYESRYQLAAIQLQANHPRDALTTLAPLLQDPDPPSQALGLAAAGYEAQQNTPLAVQTLRQAIVKDPHNVDLYLDFAVLSMDHQSYEVGIDMVNVGLQAEPQAAPLYVTRGVLYVQLAKYDEAEDDFEKAEHLDPTQGISSVAKGLEQAQENNLDRALATINSKLAVKPNDPYLLYLQANILTQMGSEPGSKSFQTALHSAKRSVALDPSLAPARDVLAKLYIQAGQYPAAIEQCREALKIDPKDQSALYHLIQAMRRTGNKQEIPDLLRRLSELRAESTMEEREHNRFKLVEGEVAPAPPAQP